MNFLLEKQSRKYFIFIGIFIICLLLCGFLGAWVHGQESKEILLEREQAMVSSLLEQGVAKDIIAASLKNTSVTENGVLLLHQIGQTEQTHLWLLPAISQSTLFFGRISIITISMLAVVLLFVTMWFLNKREWLYQKATTIITQFAEGNFQNHLPRSETGALYKLFTSIDQLATALQGKNDAEHKAKEFLKDTISDISHQLKTPIAALNMYTEIILEEPDNINAVQDFSQKSLQSLARMEQLIQSLLKIVRLDAGGIIFEKKQYFVSELVARATNNLLTRANIEKKQIIIKGNTSELLFCDLEWTGEAVGNLIKNALDYTAPGGSVYIEWERSSMMMRLSVSDDGCGISQEDIHHIFKRFYRSKQSSVKQGVGLGLPLAKAIIEGQGGLLSVQSGYREGTTFTISFLTEL